MTDELDVEFIAMLLLAPLIWSSTHDTSAHDASVQQEMSPIVTIAAISTSQPHIENRQDGFVIHPPSDKRLTMLVLKHSLDQKTSRGPASAVDSEVNSKMIEVIVSAP